MAESTVSGLQGAVVAFHALSDETRLEILERLRHGERCVCELTEALGAAQSRLSFHLRILKDAGLVHDRRDGRWTYYSICPEALRAVEQLVKEMRPASRTRSGVRCCD